MCLSKVVNKWKLNIEISSLPDWYSKICQQDSNSGNDLLVNFHSNMPSWFSSLPSSRLLSLLSSFSIFQRRHSWGSLLTFFSIIPPLLPRNKHCNWLCIKNANNVKQECRQTSLLDPRIIYPTFCSMSALGFNHILSLMCPEQNPLIPLRSCPTILFEQPLISTWYLWPPTCSGQNAGIHPWYLSSPSFPHPVHLLYIGPIGPMSKISFDSTYFFAVLQSPYSSTCHHLPWNYFKNT